MSLPLIAVLNGPNLNMLGLRQPEVYGSATLDDVEQLCAETAEGLGLAIDFRQTNSEGEYVGWIHDAHGDADGVVVNPGAWSHYSYAIRDALEILVIPIVEVHLSNIEEREEWRRHSVIADLAAHRVIGKGPAGYREALAYLAGKPT